MDKKPILSQEEAEAIFQRTPKCIDGTFNFIGYAALIEAAVLEKLCGEPYLYVYEYDRGGYVHQQLHAGMWNGARESRCIPLYALNRSKA